MPTYGYECRSCSHSFDIFQHMNDEPLKTCPECGGELRRIITGGTGIIFKGNGFYVTDKNSASGKAGKTEGSSASIGNKASDRSSASDSKPGEGAPAAPAKTETPGSGASNKDTISKTAS